MAAITVRSWLWRKVNFLRLCVMGTIRDQSKWFVYLIYMETAHWAAEPAVSFIAICSYV